MKARHKDTGEIIELAEEGIISRDGRRFCWYQVELIPEPIDECKPSLPSNLDETAEEYGRNTFINECMENGVYDDHDLSDAFKAGAKYQSSKDLAIVNDNIVRAVKCMEQSTDSEEYPYWDGAHDMANVIRREIEMEEQIIDL